MYSKKTRVISFVMAFLLIFTFAFINPLTTAKSYAAVPVLTVAAQRIIAGVLISSGIVIKGVSDLTDTQKQAMVQDFANLIWSTMAINERLILTALEIVDNIVNIPVSLYNSIKTKAQQLTVPITYAPSLEEQGILTVYSKINSNSISYPDINFNYYEGSFESGTYTYNRYEMSEASPFFVYKGVEGATEFTYDNVETNIFDYGTGSDDVHSFTNTAGKVFLTPNLSMYDINVYSDSLTAQYMTIRRNSADSNLVLQLEYLSGSNNKFCMLGNLSVSGINIYESIIEWFFIKNTDSSNSGYILNIKDLDGNLIKQQVAPTYYSSSPSGTKYGPNSLITENSSTTINSDMTFEVENSPAPVVTNTDATENVLTLPSDLATSVGLTSTEVNVGTITDTPGTDTGSGENTGTNTETMDNINTNVGELVTGGELGEQVNTNIGTLEGMHGEISEQVDFGAVFDTIAQYISSLDISAVTWFPTAVASFIVPFMPLISLGIILFFIDRVLNGGA